MSAGPEYDPRTKRITGARSAHEWFHEQAHREQHERQTLAWRVREWFLDAPFLLRPLGHVAVLWVETETALMTRRALIAHHLWTEQTRRDSLRWLGTYARAVFPKI